MKWVRESCWNGNKNMDDCLIYRLMTDAGHVIVAVTERDAEIEIINLNLYGKDVLIFNTSLMQMFLHAKRQHVRYFQEHQPFLPFASDPAFVIEERIAFGGAWETTRREDLHDEKQN